MSCPAAEFAPGEEPFVSILIPTFRRMDLLKEAIKSALGQEGYSNFEVVVSDNDPSEESTRDVGGLVAGFTDSRLRYCQSKVNLGMTGNWNRCLELARGEILTLLHDDDLLHPHFLMECVRRMSGSDLIVCRVVVGEIPRFDNETLNQHQDSLIRIDASHFLFWNISPAPGILFRRAKALEIGGFNDAWYPCSDYEFWVRFCMAYPAVSFSKPLAFYRMARNESQKLDTKIKIAEKAFAIQSMYAKKILGDGKMSRLIPAVATGFLVAIYAKKDEFRNSDEFHQFCQKYKVIFPYHRWLAYGAFITSRALFRIIKTG